MHLVSFIVDTGSIATIVSLDTVQRAGLVGFIDESVDVTLAQDVCEYIPTALGQLRVPLALVDDENHISVKPFIVVMDPAPFNIIGMDVLAHYGCILELSSSQPSLTFTTIPKSQVTPASLK